MIAKFQYLTQDVQHFTHQELALLACENGIKWIQLRVKNTSFENYLEIAHDVRKITSAFNVKLIINDNVEIAKITNADGVHLGKNDMPISEAKRVLHYKQIIGATANTLDDIKNAFQLGAHYIGLGPYKFTSTKKNLSSIVGLDGYKKIIECCKQEQINIPIIAIGGILPEDVNSLLAIGVHGVAVSSALHTDKDFVERLNLFKRISALNI